MNQKYENEIVKIISKYEQLNVQQNIKKYTLLNYSFTDEEKELFGNIIRNKESTDENILNTEIPSSTYNNLVMSEKNILQSINMKKRTRKISVDHANYIHEDTQSLILIIDEAKKVGHLYGYIHSGIVNREGYQDIYIPNFSSSYNKKLIGTFVLSGVPPNDRIRISKHITIKMYLNDDHITLCNKMHISHPGGVYVNTYFDL